MVITKLGEEEAAAVADVGIVHPELMAVITQRQRLDEIAGQWFEPAEVPGPIILTKLAEPNALCPSTVEESRRACLEVGGRHHVVEAFTKLQDRNGLRLYHRPAIGERSIGGKHGGLDRPLLAQRGRPSPP